MTVDAAQRVRSLLCFCMEIVFGSALRYCSICENSARSLLISRVRGSIFALRNVLNQLRGYVRYCKNYGTVPLEETEESAMAVYDDVLEGKVKIPVYGTIVLIGDEKLAAALLEISFRPVRKTDQLYTLL